MKEAFQFIVFELTEVCNLKCKYCYNHYRKDAEYKVVSPRYRQTLKTLRKLIKSVQIDSITFTGGEPFLSERFSELVLYTRLKKIDVSVITNGTAGSFEEYKVLKSLGVSLFELPVLAPSAEVHDKLTQIPGSWEKSLESIKNLLSIDCYVVPVFVVSKANYKLLVPTLDLLHNLGIRQVMINRFNPGGRGIGYIDELLLSKEEINEVFSEACTYTERGTMKLTSNVCTPVCVVDPSEYPAIQFTNCSSSVFQKPITVDFEGNVRICNHSPVVIGNIHKNKFAEIFKAEYLNSWSQKPEFCSECSKWDHCYAGCRAASEQLNLGTIHEDPIIHKCGISKSPF